MTSLGCARVTSTRHYSIRISGGGGNLRSFAQLEDFRDCLADCGLADMGFSGFPYTWDNKRDGDDNVKVRLDRAVCSNAFLACFPESVVEHIVTEESDHQALLIMAMETAPCANTGGPRPFRFEEAGTRHEQYDSMVEEAWEAAGVGGFGLDNVWQRLATVSGSMQR